MFGKQSFLPTKITCAAAEFCLYSYWYTVSQYSYAHITDDIAKNCVSQNCYVKSRYVLLALSTLIGVLYYGVICIKSTYREVGKR